MLQTKIDKQFLKWNALGLGIMTLFLWLKSPDGADNFIFWPGAFCLSIWILSQSLPMLHRAYQTDSSLLNVRLCLVAMIFGVIHFGLTGLLIILLERLFLLKEHYTLAGWVVYAGESWPFAIEGAAICLLYFVLFQSAWLLTRLREERERHDSILGDLRSSDLQMLKSELNPHFLYNAMNGISMKVRLQEGKAAIKMIAALTDLLRTILSSKKVHLVPLEEEITYLNKYLSIEEARFGKQATMELSFPEDTMQAMVPPLILQPLVENAFKHGVPSDGEASISVSAVRVGPQLVIDVFNAKGADKMIITESTGKGVGLPNVIHRLRRLYGVEFRFQVLNQPEGVLCKLTVPFRT